MKKRIATLISAGVLAVCLTGCASNVQIESSGAEGSDASVDNAADAKTSIPDVSAAWAAEAPAIVGNDEVNAKIGNIDVVESPNYGYVLVIDLEFTNNSETATNLINNTECDIQPYQNGIALDTPGVTSEQGYYNYNDSFTSVKNGGTIKTQLAWVLRDAVNPVEIEFGTNEEYQPDFIETVELSGGTSADLQASAVVDIPEAPDSGIAVSWADGEAPAFVGDDETTKATIGEARIVNSPEHGYLLVIDFEFTNNLSSARNLINNTNCDVQPYQNGIALDTPGVTSEQGYYNYNDSFTSVKNGGTIKTQLAWSLRDIESPVEIEFGTNEEYQPDFTKTLIIG